MLENLIIQLKTENRIHHLCFHVGVSFVEYLVSFLRQTKLFIQKNIPKPWQYKMLVPFEANRFHGSLSENGHQVCANLHAHDISNGCCRLRDKRGG